MDIQIGDLIVGLLMTALGLIGLFAAAGAQDNEMYIFGLALAGWAVLFVFGLMRRHYDRCDAARALVHASGDRHV